MSSSKYNLESFPLDLLSLILTYLPDLESLDNAIRASPTAFRTFNNSHFSVQIFEGVLSAGITHKYSYALIKIIILIRTHLLPMHSSKLHNLTTFKYLIVHETTLYRYKPLH